MNRPRDCCVTSPGWLRRILISVALLFAISGAASAAAAPAHPVAGYSDRADGSSHAVALTPAWATKVSVGSHSCALTTTGEVKCWGDNSYGQLGEGTTQNRLAPVSGTGVLLGAHDIAAGGSHTCALTASHGVACWGENVKGQLGDGTQLTRLVPTPVVGLDRGVRAISAGTRHTCALLESGGVQCWGNNYTGQLGDGTTVDRYTPVDVIGLGGPAQAVSAGGGQTCALLGNGGVKCWGDNYRGALGDGTTIDRYTPVDVIGLGGPAQAISAGGGHTCAITVDGHVKCWGMNNYGQLGNGAISYFSQPTPTDVVGLAGVATALSVESSTTCAAFGAGGVQCWGDNTYGQLGDGTTAPRKTPVSVAGLTARVTSLATGLHTCAVTDAGSVQCWGYNASSALGDGTTAHRLTPVDVLMLSYDCSQVTDLSHPECKALIAFFDSTHGISWRDRAGWLEGATPCAWPGITCAAGHVSQFIMQDNHLDGPLPQELGDLAALQALDLRHNMLSRLPATVGQLTDLRTLELSYNYLDGPLPAELGNLTRLPALDLHANSLDGPVPAELGNLTGLTGLDLSYNTFNGALPAQLGNLAALTNLDASHNQFTGPPPPELGRLTALRELRLSHNQFTALPGALGNLAALTCLDLSYNYLASPIPPEWGRLAALQELNLASNDLTGPLPPELGQLRALVTLDLSRNGTLSSTLPGAWGGMSSLVTLNLHNDVKIHGLLPAEWGALTSLQKLDAYYAQLSGPLPAEWGGLVNLAELDMRANLLTGPIPASWGNLVNLVDADLSANQIAGPLPTSLGQLAKLKHLNLRGNRLSGAIPLELGRLTTLEDLFLDHNELSGPIPPELGNLSGIRARYGSSPGDGSALSPNIPEPIHGYLDLRDNRLSGPVPVELVKLCNAASIGLGCNLLSGVFPPPGGEGMDRNTWAEYNMLSGWDVHGYWDLTQTVSPTNVQTRAGQDGVVLTWSPIPYTGDGGFYEVGYSSAPAGPYTVHGHTSSKTTNSYMVTGLVPNRTYYFRLRTFTPAHQSGVCNQRNSLWSTYTPPTSGSYSGTPITPTPTSTATVTETPSPTETATPTPTPSSTPTPTGMPTYTATSAVTDTPLPRHIWLPLLTQ